jgi:long-chain acyl-CoA synthetase
MSDALCQAWEKTWRRWAGDRAVVSAVDSTSVTFRQLECRANAWRAAHLPPTAQWRGRAVVFAVENGVAWLVMFIALLKVGAVAVPLDAGEPAEARRRIATALRAAAWWNGTAWERLAGAKAWRDPRVALIKLTSGTTGQPRALVFTAEQLLADARQVTATMRIGTHDLNYALIPFGHSYGLGNLTIPLVAQGVPLVCGSSPWPHAIAADFARWRPTVFPGVPALWRGLAMSELTLPGLRLGVSAGAPLAPAVAQDFLARFGRRLHSFYGSSETGGITYDRTGSGALAGDVGRALRGVNLVVRKGGRLEVSSAAVMTQGNRRRGGLRGAWIMPDRVQRDGDGVVTLLGRRGATVKIAGRRVNLTEVVARLRRVEGVRDAWAGVSGGADPALGAVVATDRSAGELRAALLTDTAAWKIPKKLMAVAALPLTGRGKTDGRALHAMAFGRGAGVLPTGRT